MKQLIVGKTGPVKASSVKAVHAMIRERTGAKMVEHPDLESPAPGAPTVRVQVNAPKAAEYLSKRKKSVG